MDSKVNLLTLPTAIFLATGLYRNQVTLLTKSIWHLGVHVLTRMVC